MSSPTEYILITDIGSTTTKAVLIDNRNSNPNVIGIAHAETTVEEPFNDVRHGVVNAAQKLQDSLRLKLFRTEAGSHELDFASGIKYLSTSSAGGGLQILVIGLTLFDSAASARRAAFGAGGVILDVFAIDDKRSAADQMIAMRNLHPDMILLCGGTDGGALTGILRLAEILRIAKPLPKYATNQKIPTIYAGNKEAQVMVKKIVSKDFDLLLLPNLRPTLQEENLKPTQDAIQKLFMENVMERAPGYAELKKHVQADILPTPMGVLKSLISTTEDDKRSFFAFDIGGATTDVFSYIKNFYQRTVSANLGMSYSASNVLSESGIDTIMMELPGSFTETRVRDYIGNKTLYPTYNPTETWEIQIEHVLAKQAIRLALDQHEQMHYNTQKIGFLDSLKTSGIDAYEAKFEYQAAEASLYFYPIDIDVLIGAGGVFAHAQNRNQCAAVLIDGFDAHGITELWLDKDFITPHMGVLASIEPKMAKQLLMNSCMEKLALHIRPYYRGNQKKAVMEVEYTLNGSSQKLEVMPETFILLEGHHARKLIVRPLGKCILGHDDKEIVLETSLPVMIDTRSDTKGYNESYAKALQLYSDHGAEVSSPVKLHNNSIAVDGDYVKVVSLPYKGDIYYQVGSLVQPDDIVACNQFSTPRLFIVNPYRYIDKLTEVMIRTSLLIDIGSVVDFNTNLRHFEEKPNGTGLAYDFPSPIRGKLEFIDYQTGNLVFSEIQDYSSKPVYVDLAEKMMCPPKLALRYLKKNLGDYVYHGDLLAQRLETNKGELPVFVRAPSTGVISDIDHKNAIVTIQYKVEPHNFYAHVYGKVIEVTEGESIAISYHGVKLDGKLGVGKRCHGEFIFAGSATALENLNLEAKVLGIDFAPDTETLDKLVKARIKGLVCPGLQQADMVNYLNNELGVINTGNEQLPFALMITEAFGAQKLSNEHKKVFKEMNGVLCHLETHTRIRAGVARPYICFMPKK